MKILIVTQYYFPENFKSNDLSFELQKRGHDVTVLTGLPNYPEGRMYDGYGFFKNRKQEINGVKVIRSLMLLRGKGGGMRLFLNYFSFAFFASIKAFFGSFSKKYDAIIVHEPSPVTQYYPAFLLNKLQGTPVYFWVMDLWPESLVAGGVKNKFVLSIFRKMVISFYKNSEKILITSKGFRKSILEKGDFNDKIEYFPNWAEDTVSNGNKCYKIPVLPEGFKVMFAGNVGEAQDMESVMSAALENKNNKEIKWIIIGDGRKMPFVRKFIKKNSLQETVFTFGRFPIEAMASFFDKADVMLVSLKNDPILNLTVPAKIQAYMSAGKPIIAMLNGAGADAVLEANAGSTVNAGDFKKLVIEVNFFSKFPRNKILEIGANSRKYYLEHFQLSECMNNLEKIIGIKQRP